MVKMKEKKIHKCKKKIALVIPVFTPIFTPIFWGFWGPQYFEIGHWPPCRSTTPEICSCQKYFFFFKITFQNKPSVLGWGASLGAPHPEVRLEDVKTEGPPPLAPWPLAPGLGLVPSRPLLRPLARMVNPTPRAAPEVEVEEVEAMDEIAPELMEVADKLPEEERRDASPALLVITPSRQGMLSPA